MYEIRRDFRLIGGTSMVPTPAAIAEDAATTAWVNAVVAAGGSVSGTQRGRVDALIVSLKAASLFSINSRLWIHAGESDAKQATIDLMGLTTATLTGTPPLGATGYTGNGSSRFINYGAIPSDYTLDSASYGAYNKLSNTTQSNDVLMGVIDGIGLADLLALQNASGALIRMNADGSETMFAGNTNRKGLFLASRRGTTDAEAYYNGASAATSAAGSNAISGWTGGFYGLARNNAGTADLFSSDIIAMAWIGPALDDTQESNLATAMNAYMTAWGINEF